jgi:hypothetical protein
VARANVAEMRRAADGPPRYASRMVAPSLRRGLTYTILAAFACGGREGGAGQGATCDDGDTSPAALDSRNDAEGSAEDANAMASETGGPGGSPTEGGLCTGVGWDCVGLQPRILCTDGQWQNAGPACSDSCEGGACLWLCNPLCLPGSLCGSHHMCHLTMK